MILLTWVLVFAELVSVDDFTWNVGNRMVKKLVKNCPWFWSCRDVAGKYSLLSVQFWRPGGGVWWGYLSLFCIEGCRSSFKKGTHLCIWDSHKSYPGLGDGIGQTTRDGTCLSILTTVLAQQMLGKLLSCDRRMHIENKKRPRSKMNVNVNISTRLYESKLVTAPDKLTHSLTHIGFYHWYNCEPV